VSVVVVWVGFSWCEGSVVVDLVEVCQVVFLACQLDVIFGACE